MSRRLLPVVAVVLLGALSGACADDVGPAVSVGKDVEITHDELLDEVGEWAASPTLIDRLGVTAAEGAGPGSFSTELVDLVLTNRIRFDVHHVQFEALDLAISDEEVATVRAGLFPDDPEASQAVLEELDSAFADRLVTSIVEQSAVGQAMAEEYEAWLADALADVDVSPRYGSWDPEAAAVLPPEGPRPAPGGDQLVEL